MTNGISLVDIINEIRPSLMRTVVPFLTILLYNWIGTEFVDEGMVTTLVAAGIAFLQYGLVRVAEAVKGRSTLLSLLIGGRSTPKYEQAAQEALEDVTELVGDAASKAFTHRVLRG